MENLVNLDVEAIKDFVLKNGIYNVKESRQYEGCSVESGKFLISYRDFWLTIYEFKEFSDGGIHMEIYATNGNGNTRKAYDYTDFNKFYEKIILNKKLLEKMTEVKKGKVIKI